jgi:hypothetical protein
MTPEAEIALAGLAFTVFCALAGLIWKAATQHAKQMHLEDSYVAIHSRLDGFRTDIQLLREALIGSGIPLTQVSLPPPSPRSRIPIQPERST